MKLDEKKYKILFESSPTATGIGTLDGRVFLVNKAMEKLLGYSMKELKKLNIGDLYADPKDREGVLKLLNKHGFIRDHKVVLKNKNGKLYCVLTNIEKIILGGQPVIVTSHRDMTELNIAETDRYQCEEKFRLLVENLQEGIVLTDDKEYIKFANPAFCEMLQYTEDEIMNLHLFSLMDKSGIEIAKSTIEKCRQNIKNSHYNELIKKDGTRISVYVKKAPVYEGDGNFKGILAAVSDITERIKIMNDFWSSEHNHLQLIELAQEGYWSIGIDGNNTFVNKRMCEMTGYSKEEMIGLPPTKFMSRDNGNKFKEAFLKCRDGVKTSYNSELLHKDGSLIFVNIKISPSFYSDNSFSGAFALINDFTKLRELENEIKNTNRELIQINSYHQIIGKSECLKTILGSLSAIADIDCNVLIEGESGTGKNLIAKALHEISVKKDKPFIVVNCGALPETLLESELFGYVKGAFTGAEKDKPGKFTIAEGGMIFLDEIGEIPLNIQVKLLRIIDEKCFEPIGSNKLIRANVRVITATNKDLRHLVRLGKFRKDLYYRLNIVNLIIPPLRERHEDIILLAKYFLETFNDKYKKNILHISNDFLYFLMSYEFPGNIRELKNIMERAIIFCNDSTLHVENMATEYIDIFNKTFNDEKSKNASLRNRNILVTETIEKNTRESFVESNIIISAIEKCGGNKAMAARMLKIDKTTLWRKIKKYGLDHLLNASLLKRKSLMPQDYNEDEKRTIMEAMNRSDNVISKASKMLNIDRTTLWRKLRKYKLQ